MSLRDDSMRDPLYVASQVNGKEVEAAHQIMSVPGLFLPPIARLDDPSKT